MIEDEKQPSGHPGGIGRRMRPAFHHVRGKNHPHGESAKAVELENAIRRERWRLRNHLATREYFNSHPS